MAKGQDAVTNWSATPRRAFRYSGTSKAGCMLALLVSARFAAAQSAPPQTAVTEAQTKPAETLPATPPKITYAGGQLKIDAVGATLADVLTKIAALAGVTIEIPPSARTEKMPFVELGPGPPREVLASLLNDSNFDYLIQASDSDPLRIQSVLIMPREKKGSGSGNGNDTGGRPTRSPYVRAAAPPVKSEESPVTETNAVAAPPENAVAEANVNPQPPAAQPDQAAPTDQAPQTDLTPPPAPAPSERALQIPLAQPGTSPGAMSPPATLNSQTINQQLQQMFQQRMQMMQQGQALPNQPGKQ
jgi:hypothetical protein